MCRIQPWPPAPSCLMLQQRDAWQGGCIPELEFLPQGAGEKLHPQECWIEAEESIPSLQSRGWEGWELLWEVLWCLNQSVGIP